MHPISPIRALREAFAAAHGIVLVECDDIEASAFLEALWEEVRGSVCLALDWPDNDENGVFRRKLESLCAGNDRPLVIVRATRENLRAIKDVHNALWWRFSVIACGTSADLDPGHSPSSTLSGYGNRFRGSLEVEPVKSVAVMSDLVDSMLTRPRRAPK